ncbi:MAG TPA: pyridoxamine 5'-phosphate oxidase family protein [Candidatus Binatia bacterium]|nr:pyridoxamine 5'-phosphate oxidase family protein [Candidatus Binatia bacterium]
MIATQPRSTKNLADLYKLAPIEFDRAIAALDSIAAMPPTDPAGRYWLGTVRPDGRPHVMPVGILWHDRAFYFTAGAGTQKAKNVVRDPRCIITIAAPGLDIVADGAATRVTDEAKLQRLADAFGEGDWHPTVKHGAFWHEYSAPSAGPPPWDLYEVIPTTMYGLATDEPYGATRWRV